MARTNYENCQRGGTDLTDPPWPRPAKRDMARAIYLWPVVFLLSLHPEAPQRPIRLAPLAIQSFGRLRRSTWGGAHAAVERGCCCPIR